ncbi:MAG: GNAT family N-acetyltransferase [Myxococcales bacterium]|nr:GNAT family N-acetyltransferase [Myxococcales bacterium]
MERDVDRDVERVRLATRRLVRELGMLTTTPRDADLDVTYAQGHVLLELENGPMTVMELASALALNKSSASRTLGQLVRRGWVVATEDPHDRRRRPAALTELGREKLAHVHQYGKSQVAGALEALDAEERELVARGLSLYADAIARARRRSETFVRAIRREDNRALAEIVERVSQEYGTCGEGGPTADGELRDMYGAYSRARASYLVVVSGGVPKGGAGFGPLAGAQPDVCELRKMYLLPELRGLGVGRLLLSRIFDGARAAGYRRVYIETTAAMAAANRLYQRAGCTAIDEPLGETGHYQCNVRYVKVL